MSDPGGRVASLGRNASADNVKRRKSWQNQDRSYKDKSVPDVRSMLGAQRLRLPSEKSKRLACTSSLSDVLGSIAALLAIILVAGAILLVIAITFKSNLVYSQWVVTRDETVYYYETIDTTQVILLFSVFLAAALGMIFIYVLFRFLKNKLAERQACERYRKLYGDMVQRDLEKGGTHQTKESIAKLMNDAEKQYIAEYNKKHGPEDTTTFRSMPTSSPNVISVQRLTDSAPVTSTGRSWSMKRVLSFSRRDQGYSRADLRPKGPPQETPSTGWYADPSQIAAQLSSPDAFHRAAIAQGPVSILPASHPAPEEIPIDVAEPLTPEYDAEAKRQGPEAEYTGETRIMVTKPVEAYALGVLETDSEEDEFDKSRQHSILPHPAGENPFYGQILATGDFSHGWHEVELSDNDKGKSHDTTTGHMIAHSSSEPSSSSIESADTFELISSTDPDAAKAEGKGMLELSLEEVLPRPQTGLLNRLLRLARVDAILQNGKTAFEIQPEKEYMMNFKIRMREDHKLRLAFRWIRIKPPDGPAVRFNIEEESTKDNQWIGSACWDVCMHNSRLLTSGSDSTEPIAINVSIWAETSERPARRMKADGVMYVKMKGLRPRNASPTTSYSQQSAATFIIVGNHL